MAAEKRLIDANEAYEIARLHHQDFAKSMADLTSLREVLEEAPTVDAVEVVHGHWEKPYDAFHDMIWIVCSCCKHTGATHFKYCPSCGAKMDGERKDNDRKAD